MTQTPRPRRHRPTGHGDRRSLETPKAAGSWYRLFPTATLDMDRSVPSARRDGPHRCRFPGEAIGAPDHPHRGFETVTYMLDGEVEPPATAPGNSGVIGPGDVQWMTAGSGVALRRCPERACSARVARATASSFWVNSSLATAKMTRPLIKTCAPQISRRSSATASSPRSSPVRRSVSSVRRTRTCTDPLTSRRAEAGATLELDVPSDQTRSPTCSRAPASSDPMHVATARPAGAFGPSAEPRRIRGGAEALDVIVLAGRPLREPVVRYGPFVMNTKAEIVEAFDDYQSGRMGQITPS